MANVENTVCNVCQLRKRGLMIYCFSCKQNVHRACSQLKNYHFNEIRSNQSQWNCSTYREMIPFYNICDDEFHFINADIDISMELLAMKENVSIFDNDVFNFSHYKKSVLEKDVDPDDNYYDMNTKCNYFTNSQFKEMNSKSMFNGMSIIHFNCRSLKAKFQTRHENFHGKFSLCAEYLIRSVGQQVLSRLKVFTDYSEMFL